MRSLRVFHAFQNGIKKDGLTELIKALSSNEELEEIKINDNILKGAGEILVESVKNLKKLKIVDFSDLMIGDQVSIELFNEFKVNYS